MILFRASASLAPGATDLTADWGLLARTEAHLIPDARHFSLLQMPALHRLVEHQAPELSDCTVHDQYQKPLALRGFGPAAVYQFCTSSGRHSPDLARSSTDGGLAEVIVPAELTVWRGQGSTGRQPT